MSSSVTPGTSRNSHDGWEAELCAAGFETWRDERNIDLGRDFTAEIEINSVLTWSAWRARPGELALHVNATSQPARRESGDGAACAAKARW
jgi:hypothetical protein